MNESDLFTILSSLREVWSSDVGQKTNLTIAHRPIMLSHSFHSQPEADALEFTVHGTVHR